MDSSDIPRLLYLAVLLAAVLGYFLVENRRNLGRVAQQAAIWALIFIGVVAAVGLWDDLRRGTMQREAVMADGSVEVPKAPDGHFYVSVLVNGKPIRFVIDTGATEVVLTRADAARLGFDPATLAYSDRAGTANGVVLTAPVTLGTVEFAGFRDEAVPAFVNSGALDTSLLGMGYLSRFRITLAGDTLTLAR
ncbi:MAG: retropepsin-like aspartic protease family protein [Pseudomonadota bacterium]